MKVIRASRINGVVDAPPSKSAMIRAVAASLLSGGTSRLLNPSFCDDALAALNIVDTLGAEVHINADQVVVTGNCGLREKSLKNKTLHCGESGLCMRMFASITALSEEGFILEGSGSLLSRPMGMVEVLNKLGARCETTNGHAPITVKGNIAGGAIDVDGAESSQFLSGLLMTLPLCSGDSTVNVFGLKSKPYVELTVDILEKFGIEVSSDKNLSQFYIRGNQQYKACSYSVEGDWSGASFMLVVGAIAGSIKVRGLRANSCQADKAVIEALGRAGAEVEMRDSLVSVEKKQLNAFEFNAQDCPDLFPPLVALSAHCKGKSVIYGADRLKHKESNRALALTSEFRRLGIDVRLAGDRMEVTGGHVAGNSVDTHGDHRIAMACAIAALNGEGDVTMEDSACVFKSYPRFFEDLNTVRSTL